MKFKNLFGRSKEPAVKAEVETKPEPVVEAEAETKWRPKKSKAAAKRAMRKKRF